MSAKAVERPAFQMSAHTLAQLAKAEERFRDLTEQKKLQPTHNEVPALLRKQAI